jgi:hypothetical protein
MVFPLSTFYHEEREISGNGNLRYCRLQLFATKDEQSNSSGKEVTDKPYSCIIAIIIAHFHMKRHYLWRTICADPSTTVHP